MMGRTQMKKISHIITYVFENNCIISLAKEWISLCNGLPEFDVLIDKDKRLHLISKQKLDFKKNGFKLKEIKNE